MANEQLCKDQKVHAFPTLRLFNKKAGLAPDYSSVRCLPAFLLTALYIYFTLFVHVSGGRSIQEGLVCYWVYDLRLAARGQKRLTLV